MEPGFYNMDCVEAMKQFPDKFFDLAIVDPPYGDAGGGGNKDKGPGDCSASTKQWNRFGQRFDRYKKAEPIRRRDNLQKVSGGGYAEQEASGQRSTVKKS